MANFRTDTTPSKAGKASQETHFIDNRYSESEGKDTTNSKPKLSTTVMNNGERETAKIVMPI